MGLGRESPEAAPASGRGLHSQGPGPVRPDSAGVSRSQCPGEGVRGEPPAARARAPGPCGEGPVQLTQVLPAQGRAGCRQGPPFTGEAAGKRAAGPGPHAQPRLVLGSGLPLAAFRASPSLPRPAGCDHRSPDARCGRLCPEAPRVSGAPANTGVGLTPPSHLEAAGLLPAQPCPQVLFWKRWELPGGPMGHMAHPWVLRTKVPVQSSHRPFRRRELRPERLSERPAPRPRRAGQGSSPGSPAPRPVPSPTL